MDTLTDLAQQIAKELGEGWSAPAVQPSQSDHEPARGELVHTDGRRLQITYLDPWICDRILVTATFDHCGPYLPYDMTKVVYKAAAHRKPSSIAASLQTKLLPVYDATLKRLREHQKQVSRRHQELQDLYNKAVSIAPMRGEPYLNYGGGSLHLVRDSTAAGTSVELTTRIPSDRINWTKRPLDDRVNLRLINLPVPLALQLMEQVIQDQLRAETEAEAESVAEAEGLAEVEAPATTPRADTTCAPAEAS
ncbi:hypothetical protein [Actinomadura kijaniata]|uniref:hypothetical protein n=1 Tax=Actinomadura kijaniata TaxID=46161 RepID=UPI00082B4E9C|nr:hypothetical protein [Actinomadura kijaniata]